MSISTNRWQLWESEERKLIADRLLEDLLVWWGFEFGYTLIWAEVRRGRIQLSRLAAIELERFCDLYPEWLGEVDYLSIPRATRRPRLATVFGDLPLAIEPHLSEIPIDIYWRLRFAKLRGGPAIALGTGSTHLLLVKLHSQLPLSHQKQLLCDYLDLLCGNESRNVGQQFTGKGGIAHRTRYELELLGRYRALEANGFDVVRTLESTHQDRPCSAAVYRGSRRFIEGLLLRRWEIFEALLCPPIRDPLE